MPLYITPEKLNSRSIFATLRVTPVFFGALLLVSASEADSLY